MLSVGQNVTVQKQVVESNRSVGDTEKRKQSVIKAELPHQKAARTRSPQSIVTRTSSFPKPAFLGLRIDIAPEISAASGLEFNVPTYTSSPSSSDSDLGTFDTSKGRFVVSRTELGSGEFASVNKGTFISLEGQEVPCAIKLISLNSLKSTDDLQEARLHHSVSDSKHIPTVYDFWKDEMTHYIAIELCDRSLETPETHTSFKVNPESRKALMVDVAQALHDIHEKGILHADIKPSNILIKDERIKLADFGKAQEGSIDGFQGTKRYLPSSEIPQTPATDMYMYGAVMAEICFGLSFDKYDPKFKTLIEFSNGISEKANEVLSHLKELQDLPEEGLQVLLNEHFPDDTLEDVSRDKKCYMVMSQRLSLLESESKPGNSPLIKCYKTLLAGADSIPFDSQVAGLELLTKTLVVTPVDSRLTAKEVLADPFLST